MSPIGSKIDFKGDPIFESAAWFFVIIIEFIFTSIFEIKIYEKKIPDTKKFSFSRADFVFMTYWPGPIFFHTRVPELDSFGQ